MDIEITSKSSVSVVQPAGTGPGSEALAREAAQRFTDLATEAVDSRVRFSVALSGGSTPTALYSLLAKDPYRAQIPWAQVHLFWGDERCVPPDHPDSNFRLADVTLLSHVPIPSANVYRIRGEIEPHLAARTYEGTLQDYFCGPRTRFDLVLLGLGDDGHTASLFPDSAALQERERLVVAVEASYQDRPARRVTLTLPAINTARQVLFFVTGRAKAGIVRAVLEGPEGHLPAQQIQPAAGQIVWMLDREAASQLETPG
jgi:6-phosphogluconolactonase